MVQRLHDFFGHPAGQNRRQDDCQQHHHAHRVEHSHHQHQQGLLAGGNPQHAAVRQALCLIHPLFQQGIRLTHRAAGAVLQGLPDFLPLQMVLHLRRFGVGVEDYRAVALDPGQTEAFGFHGF